jgi:hypothetical protein
MNNSLSGSSTDSGKRGDILFYDPNELMGGDLSVNPPEDLSISVDLTVRKSDSNGQASGKYFQVEWVTGNGSDASRISLFSGKRMEDGTNAFTDFYSEMVYDSAKHGDINEAFGIRSIDIEYNSFYLPQVTVNFIDVKGVSLMAPMQEGFENPESAASSFFNALFTYPYPLFTMQVKGFYGDAVTYDLHCIDVRTSLNGETGNYEVIAKFVGYTYAFLADIPFDFILSAPYMKSVNGSNYWEEQVKTTRRFTFDGTTPLIPLQKIIQLADSTAANVEKLSSDSEAIDMQTAGSGADDLKAILRKFDVLTGACNMMNSDFFTGGDNRAAKEIRFKARKDSKPEELKSKAYRESLIELIKAVDAYNESPASKISGTLTYPGGSRDNCCIRPRENSVWLLEYGGFFDSLTEGLRKLAAVFESSKRKAEAEQVVLLSENITFRPTVGNILKIIFAHFETFFHYYFECIDAIRANPRNASDYFGSDVQLRTNLLAKGGRVTLPPFFQVSRKGDLTVTWTGDADLGLPDDKFPETGYIKRFSDSITSYSELNEVIRNMPSGTPSTPFWMPVNPFDVPKEINSNAYHSSNPYMIFSTLKFTDMVQTVGIRMFYGLSMQNPKTRGMAAQVLAKAEALNIFSALKDNRDVMRYFTSEGKMNSYIFRQLLKDGECDGIDEKLKGIALKSKEKKASVFSYLSPNGSGNDIRYNFITDANGNGVMPLYAATAGEYNSSPQKGLVRDGKFVNPQLPVIISDMATLYSNDYGNVRTAFFSIIPVNGQAISRYRSVLESADSDIASWITSSWKTEISDFANVFSSKIEMLSDEEETAYEEYAVMENGKKIPFIRRNEINTDISMPDYENDRSRFSYYFYRHPEKPEEHIRELRENGYTRYGIPQITFTPPVTWNKTLKKIGSWMGGSQTVISLFGSELYYSQNDALYKNGNRVQSVSADRARAMASKAMLFLSCAGIDLERVNDFFEDTDRPSMKRVPKAALLIAGAYLWRLNFGAKYRTDPIIDRFNDTGTEGNPQKILFSGKRLHDKMPALFTEKNGEVVIGVSPPVFSNLQYYFWQWATVQDKDGLFQLIDSELGICNANSNGFISLYGSLKGMDANSVTVSSIRSTFGEKIFSSYCSIARKPYTKKESCNINLMIRAGSRAAEILNRLYAEDALVINTYYSTAKYDGKKNVLPFSFDIERGLVDTYLQTLVEEIKKMATSAETVLQAAGGAAGDDSPDASEIINIERYTKFGLLYSKWCSGDSSPEKYKMEHYVGGNGIEGSFHVMDKFYRDISQEYIVKLDGLKDMFSSSSLSVDYSFLSFLSRFFSSMGMMFLPTPNDVNFTSVEQVKKMFVPIGWAEKSAPRQFPCYTAVYIGSNSEIPYGGTDEYVSDALTVVNDGGMYRFNAPVAGNSETGIPVFMVSFGKQNNSYFRIASLSNVNPVITEHSIRAQQDIAGQSTGGVRLMNVGQNIYSIYASNSYAAEIEMMGCAQIQPMMYFQLSNVHLFTGAYMIYRVKHSITPGKMVTAFTGLKMNRFNPFMNRDVFSFMNVTGNGTLKNLAETISSADASFNPYNKYDPEEKTVSIRTDRPKKTRGYGPKRIMIPDDDYILPSAQQVKVGRYYTLWNMVETLKSNRSRELRDKCSQQMPKKIADNLRTFIPYLENVRDNVKLLYGKDYDIRLHSVWRHVDSNQASTFHGYGKAADFTVYNPEQKESAETFKYLNEGLFTYLRTKWPLRNRITELLKESTNGEFDGCSGWIHLAILEADYPGKPVCCAMMRGKKKCIDDKKYRIEGI